MTLQIGTTIHRDSDGARYRLTGTYGRSWMAERVDEGGFEGAVRLTPRALAGFHLVDGDDLGDARTPSHRADAGEPAFSHDGSTIHPVSAGGWKLADENAAQARATEPGWASLADAHRAQIVGNLRRQAEEDRLERQHAVIADEV